MARPTPEWLASQANAAPPGFVHAPDTTAGYWCQRAENTLPPPDFWSPYARNRPLPTPGVEQRRAWIVGSGIAGLAAAFYLIRDGHMPPANITILDAAQIEGGSLDGAGDADRGYLIRGGREMNWNYDNLWDLFQDVPALELPAGYSVLDEYRWVNDRDPNYSKARLLHQQGVVQDFRTFGLSRKDQWEIVRLLLKRKDEVNDTTIRDYFNQGFFETNFWALFRTMFAFQPWHSLLEMKLYLHRFLDSVDGFADMSVVVFPKYDQFDSFVRPLTKMLRAQGVRFQFDTRATDLDFAVETEKRTVTGIRATVGGAATVLPVAAQDLVFVLPGSMTEGTAYGDMDQAPVLARGAHEPGADSEWTLWRNLAAQSPVFGKPDKFCGDVARSMWESATLTCRPSPLVDRLKELAVNDPYSGRTVTGGIITFTDSKWLLSVTCNRQPHFPDQPEDVLVLWAYALRMDGAGDKVTKPMPDCTGREILEELCHHLGIADDQVSAVAAATKVRLALMPYITAEFMPRAAGDRPAVVPQGCTNLALVGQFVETANDIVFTMESSIRTARIGVYTLLNVLKQVPDISPTQYDIRNLLRGARALNNGAPFPGERLLHRLLGKSYFAHILPPLPEKDGDALHRVEAELAGLFGRGSQWVNEAADTVRSWMAGVKAR